MDKYQLVYIFMTIVLICVGIIGNMVCLFSLCFRQAKQLRSSTVYLYALVCADLTFLVCLTVDKLKWAGIYVLTNHFSCKVFVYLYSTAVTLSSYYIATLTLERFVVIRHPLRRQSITVRRAWRTVALATSLALFLNAYAPFMGQAKVVSTIHDNYTKIAFVACTVSNLQIYTYIISLADVCWTFLGPLCIIVSLNLAITKVIFEARRFRKSSLCRSLTSVEYPSIVFRARTLTCQTTNTLDSQNHTACCLAFIDLWSSNTTERRTTIIALILSAMYVVLNVPIYSLRIYDFIMHDGQPGPVTTIERIAWFLFHAQFCVNFFFYSMLNQMCGGRRRPQSQKSTKRSSGSATAPKSPIEIAHKMIEETVM